MAEFKSRAVRSLVELHRVELRSFLETWRRFSASGKPLPNPQGDADYENPGRLAAHVQGAARSYMIWMAEQVGRPITEVQRAQSPDEVLSNFDGFAEATLAAWEKHGALFVDEELGPQQYKTRWGDMYSIDQMLEHAVVHPMRHRIQLERILVG